MWDRTWIAREQMKAIEDKDEDISPDFLWFNRYSDVKSFDTSTDICEGTENFKMHTNTLQLCVSKKA